MSTVPVQCTLLNSQSICGIEYNGYPILSSKFVAQADFDTFINSSVLNSTAALNAMNTNYGCSGPALSNAVNSRKYHASYQCSIIVQDAITQGCTFDTTKFPAAGPILCEKQCSAAVSTLQSIFANTAACPVNAAVQPARDQLVTKFQTYCTSAIAAAGKQNGLCVKGVPIESQGCGYSSLANAKIGCISQTGDACCKALLSTTGTTISSTKEGPNIGLIVGIIFGVIAIIAVTIGIIIYKRRKTRALEMEKTYGNYNSKERLNTSTSLSNGGYNSQDRSVENKPAYGGGMKQNL